MRSGVGVRSSSKALSFGLGAAPMASYLDRARGDTPGPDRLITGATQQILHASRNSAAVWCRLVPARDALVPAFLLEVDERRIRPVGEGPCLWRCGFM